MTSYCFPNSNFNSAFQLIERDAETWRKKNVYKVMSTSKTLPSNASTMPKTHSFSPTHHNKAFPPLPYTPTQAGPS